ncbi:MAG: LapA family protein [Armatimonadota bacterium]|nr:LapA family protein [Armatimonadota bacterium]MDW8156201.1 LapA family protein [Armatimonadota bacterium]
MRLLSAVGFVLAVLSVVLMLSNAGTSDRYPLRLAGWTVLHDTLPTLLVLALFAGATIAGLPLSLANWWLRRRVAGLERELRAARQAHAPRGPAPASREGSGL